MGKYLELEIKESLTELKSLHKKTKNYRQKIRIRNLILTKEKKFKDRETLAKYLGVGASSLYRWTKTYRNSGIEAMLTISNGGKRREVITSSMHQALEEKLNDSSTPLLGYWDAVIWVEEQFGQKIKYQTLRSYMKKNFGTKLKMPRKSHYKKDEQAIEAFKKTSPIISRY